MDEQPKQAPELPGAFSLLKPSWQALMLNIWTFVALLLLPIAALILLNLFGTSLSANSGDRSNLSAGVIVGVVVIIALCLVIAPALTYTELQSVRGKKVLLGEALRTGKKYIVPFFGISILSGIVVILGFLFFIVPGFFMLRRYILAPYYVFESEGTITQIMKRSAADSKRFSKAVWGVIGVSALFGLIAIVPFALFLSIPLQIAYYCAPALRYTQIQEAIATHPAHHRHAKHTKKSKKA
jgi:hypothetical protein